jgi:hypothetical protein
MKDDETVNWTIENVSEVTRNHREVIKAWVQ